MATQKQIDANRHNASLSTGPRGEQGLALASRNAARHGLSGSMAVLQGEDQQAFEELASDLRESLRPVGRLEEELVGRAAGCFWRLNRVAAFEGDVLAELGRQADVQDAARIHNVVNLYGSLRPKQPWQELEGKEELSKIYDAVRAQDFQISIKARAGGLGRGLVAEGAQKSLGLLRRYESELERGLYAAIAQLRQLQAERRLQSPSLALETREVIDVEADER